MGLNMAENYCFRTCCPPPCPLPAHVLFMRITAWPGELGSLQSLGGWMDRQMERGWMCGRRGENHLWHTSHHPSPLKESWLRFRQHMYSKKITFLSWMANRAFGEVSRRVLEGADSARKAPHFDPSPLLFSLPWFKHDGSISGSHLTTLEGSPEAVKAKDTRGLCPWGLLEATWTSHLCTSFM